MEASTDRGSGSFLQIAIHKGSEALSISVALDTGFVVYVLLAKYCFLRVLPTDIVPVAVNNTQLSVIGKAFGSSRNDGSKNPGACDVGIANNTELVLPVLCTVPDDGDASSQWSKIEALLLRHVNFFARQECEVGRTLLIIAWN
jgi:hypothetical protein